MANLLLKRIKDWATSITTFRTGDVIPVDGPDGTAKMSKDDLLARTAENTLGSIHSLSDTATDFASDDYIALDGTTNGSRKMNKDDLLKVTAQNALAGNVAPAFNPTRTSENPYKAGDYVSYEGKTYIFKVDHYGAWNASDVYEKPAYKFFLEGSFLEFPYENGFYRTDTEYVGTFTANSSYYAVKVNASVGDKFFIVGQGASAGLLWATYDKDGKVVRRASTNEKKEFEDKFVVTIADGEVGIVYNTSFFSGKYMFRLYNVPTIVEKLNEGVKDWNENKKFIFEYEFIRNYTAPAGSAIVGWYYKAPASEFSVKMTKVSGPQNYDIWMNDSTGVLSNVQYKTNCPFDEIIDITMVTGYDRIFFFAQGVTGVAVDVTAYRVFKNTLEYRIESLEGASSFRGKKIVCLGDSITQFKYNGMSYCNYLQNLTGANVVNGGVGGTRYAVRTTPTTTPTTASEAWAGVDMYNLVKSWCDNDWDIVDASAEWLYEHDGGRDISPIINRLKNNPISSADIVTLFSGTNDWAGGTAKGAVNDGNSSSLLGAISLIIEMLLAAKPTLKIFVFTPVVRWLDYSGMATSDPSKFSDVKTESGRTLKELVGWIYEAVTTLHTPVCDLYNTLGWNQYNFNGYFLDTDGTHPYKGFDSLAKRMYGFMCANNW